MIPKEQADLLKGELDRQGVNDNELRAGIAAIAFGESGFISHTETGYAHTSNQRIRTIFGGRVSNLSEPQLNELKSNEEAFFNRVYGGSFGIHNLGNTEPDDGYKYRGRGLFQLTGKSNYLRYGKLTGLDLIDNPDQANEPAAAAAIAVAYMKDRYKDGGWEGMKRAVGVNIEDIDSTKNQRFQLYLRTGEFAKPRFTGDPTLEPTVGSVDHGSDPEVIEYVEAAKKIQTFLREKGFYKGVIDGDFGGGSRLALHLYIESK